MADWREEIQKIKTCPKREDSSLEQLIDLYGVAIKLGFHDAGHIISQWIALHKTL